MKIRTSFLLFGFIVGGIRGGSAETFQCLEPNADTSKCVITKTADGSKLQVNWAGPIVFLMENGEYQLFPNASQSDPISFDVGKLESDLSAVDMKRMERESASGEHIKKGAYGITGERWNTHTIGDGVRIHAAAFSKFPSHSDKDANVHIVFYPTELASESFGSKNIPNEFEQSCGSFKGRYEWDCLEDSFNHEEKGEEYIVNRLLPGPWYSNSRKCEYRGGRNVCYNDTFNIDLPHASGGAHTYQGKATIEYGVVLYRGTGQGKEARMFTGTLAPVQIPKGSLVVILAGPDNSRTAVVAMSLK